MSENELRLFNYINEAINKFDFFVEQSFKNSNTYCFYKDKKNCFDYDMKFNRIYVYLGGYDVSRYIYIPFFKRRSFKKRVMKIVDSLKNKEQDKQEIALGKAVDNFIKNCEQKN